MTWLRGRWQRLNLRFRIAWIVVIVMVIGLIANLAAHRDPIAYAGTFAATGSMTTPRVFGTATLLPDGRVLVAGGSADGKSLLNSAELYDPATGTFSPTGSMTTPRAAAAAVLLHDGRVLIAAGEAVSGAPGAVAPSTAELYDPKSGTFSAIGPLTTARSGSSWTLLGDGRVLVAGGRDMHARTELSSAELFDPATGTFAATGSMKTGRSGAAAALLPDGRVLVAGGSVSRDPSSADSTTETETMSAELYDPTTGTFAATGPMTTALEARGATLMFNGRVLLAGGGGPGALALGSASAEVYDPETGTFSPTGSMATATLGLDAIGLPTGRVLVVIGMAPAELYDPNFGTFSASGAMIQPRSSGSTSILQDGQVLVAGGTVGALQPLSSAELFR
ncbi:MAG TPA: kelch repeat-containing protein [Candidatus Limnocylindrales bacterium]|jgi:hypothetical protein